MGNQKEIHGNVTVIKPACYKHTVECVCAKCGAVWAQPDYYRKHTCINCRDNQQKKVVAND